VRCVRSSISAAAISTPPSARHLQPELPTGSCTNRCSAFFFYCSWEVERPAHSTSNKGWYIYMRAARMGEFIETRRLQTSGPNFSGWATVLATCNSSYPPPSMSSGWHLPPFERRGSCSLRYQLTLRDIYRSSIDEPAALPTKRKFSNSCSSVCLTRHPSAKSDHSRIYTQERRTGGTPIRASQVFVSSHSLGVDALYVRKGMYMYINDESFTDQCPEMRE
jgi:hypothetical protein